MRIPVLYHDEDIIVVDKPIGIPTAAPPGDPYPGDVLRAVGAQLGLAGLTTPQRLPAELSGVLVLAARPEASSALTESLGARGVEHVYLALVHGRPQGPSGRIDAPLTRAPGEAAERYRVTNARDKRGQRAVSHYRLLDASPDERYSLLEVTDAPAEGGPADRRPADRGPADRGPADWPKAVGTAGHQVRAHLAHLGLPVVGDWLYGGGAESAAAQAEAARPGELSTNAPGARRGHSLAGGKRLADGKRPAAGGKAGAGESPGARPGPFAPRLGLHLVRFTLPHPGSGRPVTFSAPVPALFQGLAGGLPELRLAAAVASRHIRSALRRTQPGAAGPAGLIDLALARRGPLAADPGTTIYRLINGAADGLPGLAVDRYGAGLVVNVYDEGPDIAAGAAAAAGARANPGQAEPLAPALLDLLANATGASAVYVKYRQREASRVEDEDLPALAPAAPVAGRAAGRGSPSTSGGGGSANAAAPEAAALALGEYVAHEEGLAYLVRPCDGWNPGLFPDMREMRGRVRAWAAGRRVLNTFAYTCGFGVAARAGGAARVVNLDVSWPLLERGRANYRANGFRPESEDFLYGDTFDWLPRLKARHELFDLIILDPPGFARTKTHTFSAARDYGKLAGGAAGVLAPGGLLVACCNVAYLACGRFHDRVVAGLDEAWRAAEIVGRYGAPALDFPGLPGRESYLKILVARLA